jgi:hypothetical protein
MDDDIYSFSLDADMQKKIIFHTIFMSTVFRLQVCCMMENYCMMFFVSYTHLN